MGRKGNDECVCVGGGDFVFSLHFQIHSFEWEEEGMAAGPVLGTKVFTHLQEREGKGKKATQMRPMKKKTDWINSWWEKGGKVEGKGVGKRRQTFSPGP